MGRTARISSFPDGRAVVHLAGELDIATAHPTRGVLRCAAAVSPHLLVDLTEVEFMDCAGLGALMWAHHKVTAAGGAVELLGPNWQVRKLIDAAGLNETLRVVPDLLRA